MTESQSEKTDYDLLKNMESHCGYLNTHDRESSCKAMVEALQDCAPKIVKIADFLAIHFGKVGNLEVFNLFEEIKAWFAKAGSIYAVERAPKEFFSARFINNDESSAMCDIDRNLLSLIGSLKKIIDDAVASNSMEKVEEAAPDIKSMFEEIPLLIESRNAKIEEFIKRSDEIIEEVTTIKEHIDARSTTPPIWEMVDKILKKYGDRRGFLNYILDIFYDSLMYYRRMASSATAYDSTVIQYFNSYHRLLEAGKKMMADGKVDSILRPRMEGHLAKHGSIKGVIETMIKVDDEKMAAKTAETISGQQKSNMTAVNITVGAFIIIVITVIVLLILGKNQ